MAREGQQHDDQGHLHATLGGSPSPGLVACGSTGVIGALDAGSNDVAGQVTFTSGGGSTFSCTIIFGQGWSVTPICIVQGDPLTTAPRVAALSTTALTVNGSWGTVNETFRYICIGQ